MSTDAPSSINGDLAERVRARLQQNSHLHVHQSHLKLQQAGQTIIVEGCLPSFHLKQVLQEEIRKISGVDGVVNRTVVPARPT
jgi:osmotically-inducible protein OsmY